MIETTFSKLQEENRQLQKSNDEKTGYIILLVAFLIGSICALIAK